MSLSNLLKKAVLNGALTFVVQYIFLLQHICKVLLEIVHYKEYIVHCKEYTYLFCVSLLPMSRGFRWESYVKPQVYGSTTVCEMNTPGDSQHLIYVGCHFCPQISCPKSFRHVWRCYNLANIGDVKYICSQASQNRPID